MREEELDNVRATAWLQLIALRTAGVIRPECSDFLSLAGEGTILHDLNGEELALRIPLITKGAPGYVDIALHPTLGSLILAVRTGKEWNEDTIAKEARERAKQKGIGDNISVEFI